MADNVVLDPGTGGATIATDDDGIAQHQYVKLEFGGDGTFTKVSAAAPLPVDGSGVTQPISAASLPLPTGAATAAKQPALGTAGTASADVLTVQGIASMTALKVDASGTAVPITDNAGSLTVDGTVGVSGTVTVDSELTTADLDTGVGTDTRAVVGLVYGASGGGTLVSTTNPLPVGDNGGSLTVDNGGTFAVQAAQSGTWTVQPGNTANTTAWKVDASSVAVPVTDNSSTLSVDDGAGSLTVDGTVGISGTVTVDSELTTADLDTGAGTDTRAVVGLVYGASGGGTLVSTTNPLPIGDNGGSLTVDGTVSITANSAVNCAQMNGIAVTMGNGVSGTGVQRVTIASDSTGTVAATQSGTWTVQPGNTANTTAWLTSNTPSTSGGLSISRVVSAASTNATSAKASAGQVYGWYLSNSNAANRYFKLYNKASAPTVGTDTPVMTIMIPAGGAANVLGATGIAFGTGIAYALTTGAADSDTGAVAANEIIANVFYK